MNSTFKTIGISMVTALLIMTVFSFSTKEESKLNSQNLVNNQVPVGTIVASVLDYTTFLQTSGLENTQDMHSAIWIPCDGRTVNACRFSKFSNGKIPDLRGVFLRGINDYNVSFPGVGPVSNEQKNPENKIAGDPQPDQLGSHNHRLNIVDRAGIPTSFWTDRVVGGVTITQNPIQSKTAILENEGGTETRPKNVTVYYYIKIN